MAKSRKASLRRTSTDTLKSTWKELKEVFNLLFLAKREKLWKLGRPQASYLFTSKILRVLLNFMESRTHTIFSIPLSRSFLTLKDEGRTHYCISANSYFISTDCYKYYKIYYFKETKWNKTKKREKKTIDRTSKPKKLFLKLPNLDNILFYYLSQLRLIFILVVWKSGSLTTTQGNWFSEWFSGVRTERFL